MSVALLTKIKDAHGTSEVTLAVPQQAGYSSVGRASDCRHFADVRWSLAPFRVAGLLSAVDMIAVMSVEHASKEQSWAWRS